MSKLSQKETQDLLIGAGREIANHQLGLVVEEAPDSLVMNNQLEVIRRSAISILALHLYNDLRQDGRDTDKALDALIIEIEAELAHCVSEGESYMLLTPGGRKS